MANVVLRPWVKVVGVIAVVAAIMFGASKFFGQTQTDTKLYRDVDVPDTNGYEIKQYILNNYKNNIQGTIWEEIQNCEYPIYIPDKKQLKKYMIYTMLSSLALTMVVQSILLGLTYTVQLRS